MKTEQKEELRFQECPWYIQVWRYRWYLLIPWWTVQNKLTPWREEDGSLAKEEPWNTWRVSLSLAIGTAQGKMKWYYTLEEVMKSLDKRTKSGRL